MGVFFSFAKIRFSIIEPPAAFESFASVASIRRKGWGTGRGQKSEVLNSTRGWTEIEKKIGNSPRQHHWQFQGNGVPSKPSRCGRGGHITNKGVVMVRGGKNITGCGWWCKTPKYPLELFLKHFPKILVCQRLFREISEIPKFYNQKILLSSNQWLLSLPPPPNLDKMSGHLHKQIGHPDTSLGTQRGSLQWQTDCTGN